VTTVENCDDDHGREMTGRVTYMYSRKRTPSRVIKLPAIMGVLDEAVLKAPNQFLFTLPLPFRPYLTSNLFILNFSAPELSRIDNDVCLH
jgi:hypothetical protein